MKRDHKACHPGREIPEPCSKELHTATELVLNKSEDGLRALFDAAEDAIFIKDENLVYTHVNPAVEGMLSLPAESIIGCTDYQLFDEKDAGQIVETDRMVLNGEIYRGESTRIVNGRLRSFNVVKVPIRSASGEITGLAVISRDVTERKRGQKRLEILNQCFLAFTDDPLANINRLVALCGELLGAGCALYNRLEENRLYCLGQWQAPPDFETVDMAEGHICTDVIKKENQEVCLIRNLPDSIYAKTDPIVMKYGLKTYVGRAVSVGGQYVGALCVVYRDDYMPAPDELTLLDIISVAVSIEEKRRLAEQVIKDSRQKYRNLIENVTDVIFQLDKKGDITYISPSVIDYVGTSPEETIGRNYIEFVHKEDLAIARKSFHSNLEGANQAFEFRVLTTDGTVKYVRTCGRQLIEGEKVVGLIGTLSDITTQKQMEQELFQSRKMEAIGQLAGGVAHDFNNMLASILGNAEILSIKLAGDPELAEYIKKIVIASEHAANLTRQLLSFARKDQFRPIPVDIHQSLGDVVDILGNTIDRRIRIIQEFNAHPATVLADPSQLENAILNLGLNARDAMPNGGELTFATDMIICSQQDDMAILNKMAPGKYIKVSVSDTGIGMSDQVMEHLFEPFFTTKEPGKGTGLGLASAYGIIQNHDGHIEIASREDRGTTVDIYLPLENREVKETSSATSHPGETGSGRVMLIDDEPLVRETAAQILKRLGYTVTAFEDGEAAICHFRENIDDFDMVVLDMIMPKLSGKETFLKLREIDPKVKVVLSSGFSAEGDAGEILGMGASGFVQKPYRMAELASAIKKALEGKE